MRTTAALIVLLAAFTTIPASAHFGMLIPSKAMITADDAREVELTLSFSHPFEWNGMDMAKPKVFGVVTKRGRKDLTGALKPTKIMGRAGWRSTFPVRRPGVYQFYFEPEPYWEPAEDCFIIHYTKTVVAAFGDEEYWDAELGLKTEIVPLTRPFGLYAGNTFKGVVKLDGKPVPFAEVEVEFRNPGGKVKAPNDYFVTQVVKADANGVFCYTPPAPGWWGFAALNTADEKMNHDGKAKDVELGAVLWVHFAPWPGK